MKFYERIAQLEAENERLRQQILAAAQWCNEDACEFKKLRRDVPSWDDPQMAKVIEDSFKLPWKVTKSKPQK